MSNLSQSAGSAPAVQRDREILQKAWEKNRAISQDNRRLEAFDGMVDLQGVRDQFARIAPAIERLHDSRQLKMRYRLFMRALDTEVKELGAKVK